MTLTLKRKDMKYTLPGVGDSGDWVACNAAVANKLGAVAAVMYAEGYTYCGMLKSEEKNSSLYKKSSSTTMTKGETSSLGFSTNIKVNYLQTTLNRRYKQFIRQPS